MKMKMKRIIILMMFGITMMSEAVIFEYQDIIGDDNGPGTYIYPTNKVFVESGFDIKKVKIEEEKDFYNFVFEIPVKFKNEWKNANGWDIQQFDVYMNFGKGKNKHTISGRNVKIKKGWDKVLLVSPAKNEVLIKKELIKNDMISDDSKMKEENIIKDILLPELFEIKGNVLTAKIKKINLKDMKKLKGVQVFMTSAEAYPGAFNTYIRTVNKEKTEWRFGGGVDDENGNGDPNVIDILGENKSLANYN
ncbi:MAG: hypothetical protein B6I28_05660 [Fusobacteriia bacterium 4572_132]|nr:MAG: hypothetical protein B6I28_05660 [Fusobacteriia bacterium 4572_132]